MECERRGKAKLYSQVRNLFSKNNPDILTCMETRSKTSRALKIIKRVPMSNFLEIPSLRFLEGFGYFLKTRLILRFLS